MDLPLFPLNTVLFPGMALPLHIFEPRYQRLINSCLDTHQPFGVVLIRSGAEVGGPAQPHSVGTTARITSVERLPAGRLNIETVGQERFRILGLRTEGDLLVASAEPYPLEVAADTTERSLAHTVAPWLARYLDLLSQAADSQITHPTLPDRPAALAYLAAIIVQAPMNDKQALLAIPTLSGLLQREIDLFRREISLLRAMVTHRSAPSEPASFSPN
jgi:Lon protease-like protein